MSRSPITRKQRGRVLRKQSRWRPSSKTITFLLVIFCLLFPLLFCALPVKAHETQEGTEPTEGHVIGIDLGTTYSCTGVYRNGGVEIIPNQHGDRTTPSYVGFTPDGRRLVGTAAKNQASGNPHNTIFDIKRVLGRPFSDASLKDDTKHFPFTLESKAGKPVVKVDLHGNGKPDFFTPEQISAQILSDLKANAEAYLGEPVTKAVITVPAYFNDAQRAATKDAGKLAGLEVLRIVNEPTAAALAYGIGLVPEGKIETKTIVVYDLGGGTFDVSLLEMEVGVFEVLATGGDTHLGGEDFDNRVIDHFTKAWNSQHPGSDVSRDASAMSKLKGEVEKAKRVLSSEEYTTFDIDDFHDGRDFSATLTRAKFEELNQDLFKRTLNKVEDVLRDAKIEKDQVTDVVLVGGSTRIPKIRQMLTEHFSSKKLRTGIDPDEAVAYGAAIQGGILSGANGLDGCLLEVSPFSLGIETDGGKMATIIRRFSPIPTRNKQTFSTTQDNQDTVQIKVFEGESAMSSENNLLGSFELAGIAPAPRGIPQIEVTFEIDVNGLFEVSAVDKATGKSQSARITTPESRLSDEDIDRMLKDESARKTRMSRALAGAKSRLESQLYSVENLRKHLGAKLSHQDKQTITTITEEITDWLRHTGPFATYEEVEKKAEELGEQVSSITSKLDRKPHSYGHGEL